MDLAPNKNITFEELRVAVSNAINVSLARSLKTITLGEITPALKYWLVKELAWNGYGNIRALPDRDIHGAIFLKLTHGKGIATFYATKGNGFIQIEIAEGGIKLGTIAEAVKRAGFKPKDNTRHLGRLRIYKEARTHAEA